jgi:hypothetical protein
MTVYFLFFKKNAKIMRQSKTENSLIYLWLIFIQTHYGIYRVDNRHECHRERNRTKKEKNHNLIEEDDDMMKLKRMRQKGGQNKNAESKMKGLKYNGEEEEATQEEEEETIIRPFQWAPHFYGCIRCGRYHFCRRKESECEILLGETDGQMLCAYSGHLLKESTTYCIGHFSGERNLDNEGFFCGSSDMEIELRTNRSTKPVSKVKQLYTNIHIKQPYHFVELLCDDDNEDTLAYQKNKRRRHRQRLREIEEEEEDLIIDKEAGEWGEGARVGGGEKKLQYFNYNNTQQTKKGEMLVERLEEEEGGGGEEVDDLEDMVENTMNNLDISINDTKYKNIHPNKIYWNEYYQFLLPCITLSTDPVVINHKKQAPIIKKHLLQDLSKENIILINTSLYEIISRLLVLQTKQKSLRFDQNKTQMTLIQYYTPITSRMIQLILFFCEKHSLLTQRLPIRHLCLAFLLEHLSKSYFIKDSHDYHICVWYRDQWLAHLEETGITNYLYSKKTTGGKKQQKRDNTRLYDKKQVSAASMMIKRTLSFCQTQPFWLRDFILNGQSV